MKLDFLPPRGKRGKKNSAEESTDVMADDTEANIARRRRIITWWGF